jgi:hypothetical protein
MNGRIIALSSIVAAALPAFAAGLAEPPGILPELRAPAGEKPAFALQAVGVQIYTCKAGPGGYEHKWAFVAPEATLTENGAIVGHHGAGPTWESTSDKSATKGRGETEAGRRRGQHSVAAARRDPPTETRGRFAGVTNVQRVATKGGVEPAGGCDAAHSGQEARVPYTADYYFYKRS